MSDPNALPLKRYWLASGAAAQARDAAIDAPHWPAGAVPTVIIATDDEAFQIFGDQAVDGRGLALSDALGRAGLADGDGGFVQIVETAVLDFLPALERFAERLEAERAAIAAAAVLRLGVATSDLVEPAADSPPAAYWIAADRLDDLLAHPGSLSEKLAAFRRAEGATLDDRLVIGGYCAADDDPSADSILAAKCAAAIAAADRLRYEKRRTQRANRILRHRNDLLKAELGETARPGLFSRLFRR